MVRRIENATFSLLESDITLVNQPISLSGIDAVKPHCFAGIQFFEDPGGIIPAVAEAGTVTITVETVNTTPLLEAVPANVIQASSPTTISWGANTQRVLATPSGIIGPTHYRLIVTCNET